MYSYIDSETPLQLSNCNGNNLGWVNIKVPGFTDPALLTDAIYCSNADVSNGKLCANPAAKEEQYLNSQKAQELSADIVSAQDEADPVNLTTGEFTYDTNVMYIPGKGMPFDFGISYKNQYQYG